MTAEPRVIPNEPALENPRLAEAMEEYLAELETGVRPDRQRFLARYGDIAVELAACLEGLDFIHCVAPQLQEVQAQPGSGIRPLATLGDYRIVREIGRGGMAVVYEAEQLSLGRTVALKVLPFASMLDERQFKRFQNEARAAASLDHPHIVPIYGFGTDRGVHYYAMRLIDGLSLDHLLHSLKPDSSGLPAPPATQALRETADWTVTHLTPDHAEFYRSVARIGLEAAEALAFAHAQGVLHRDIKPGNLLIDQRGSLWVADFGMARIESDMRLTRSGDVVGTLRYMSPEQMAGKPLAVDPRSDIYSLGTTLYELTTLRPVFDARDRQQLLKQIGAEEAPSPQEINKAVPAALSTIIHTCIQKDPAERYESAQDLADDLRRYLEDKPIHARPWTFLEAAASWLRRHRSLAWTAAAIMALISCGLGLSTFLILRESAEAVRQRDEARRQEIVVLEREKSLRRYLYAADMKLAWQSWSNAWHYSDLSQVHYLLARHEPAPWQEDLRSFAWQYLKGQCGQTARSILAGHEGKVYHLAISPDGRTLASASQDTTAKLWDLATGQLRSTLRGHTGEVNCVVFAPDGMTLVTASDDRTVKFWNPLDGQQHFSLALPEFVMPVHRLEFSPDGTRLVTGELSEREDAAAATLWDFPIVRQHARLEGHFPLAFSPDSNTLATTSWDKVVRLWRVVDGREVTDLRGNTGIVRTGAFSPDGRLLASGSEDGLVRFWNVNNREYAGDLYHWTYDRRPNAVSTLAYSAGGLLATGHEDGGVRLWEATTGTRKAILVGNEGRVRAVRFTPDGRTLATASDDRTVKLWDITATHSGASPPDQPAPVTSISFSYDSELLATLIGQSCRLWNVPTGDVQAVTPDLLKREVLSVAFCPVGRLLATATSDNAVYVLNPLAGEQQLGIAGQGQFIGSVVYSPDGAMLAGAFRDGAIRVWDTRKGLELHAMKLSEHTQDAQDARKIAFSPDGKTLALARGDHVKRWNLTSGALRDVWVSALGEVNCLAFSPDGQTMATGSAGRQIQLWDTHTDQEQANFSGHGDGVGSLAFSPDGRTLASGSGDGELKLWDVATRQELFSLAGHTGPIHCAAFSPDGQTLATAGTAADGEHGEIKFWRTARSTSLPLRAKEQP